MLCRRSLGQPSTTGARSCGGTHQEICHFIHLGTPSKSTRSTCIGASTRIAGRPAGTKASTRQPRPCLSLRTLRFEPTLGDRTSTRTGIFCLGHKLVDREGAAATAPEVQRLRTCSCRSSRPPEVQMDSAHCPTTHSRLVAENGTSVTCSSDAVRQECIFSATYSAIMVAVQPSEHPVCTRAVLLRRPS